MAQLTAQDAAGVTVKKPPHSLKDLEKLLALGWQIEPPVLARLSWGQQRAGELAYHFILARKQQRSLVVIADSPELHRFLTDHAIAVV